MDNKQIAEVFEEIGNILDIMDVGFFRVNAYRKGAITVLNLPNELREVVKNNPKDISKIPGIGKALSEKIIELVETGKCKELEKLRKNIPEGLLEILKLRGLGPKKVKLLYSQLAIKNIKELKAAAENKMIRTLDGMGEKSEEDILKAIEEFKDFSSDRHLIHEADMEAKAYIEYMKKLPFIEKIQHAGSLRRFQETIGDIDILVTVIDPKKHHEEIMQHFVKYKEVVKIIAKGGTKSTVLISSGLDVDLRVVESKSFGAALHYFTGSKLHNIRVRDLAKKKGLKVSEYGVFSGNKMVAGETEDEIFKMVGLPFIPPELRRDDGEIEYGVKHKKMPKLVELKDIRGDLHSHSTFSDGKRSIEEMANEYIKLGYEYFAVTDHSPAMGITGGVQVKDFAKQWHEIDKLNKKLDGKIKILKGSEVDVLKDGSLDYPDEVLKKLDVVIISAHLHGRLSYEEQTKRLIRAIENPHSMILGHPTGRLLNKRSPMEFDMQKIISACVENKVSIEINSNPMRLDLPDVYVKMARDKGAKFVISTDSHDIDQPKFIQFGVGVARRGWLEKGDILNTNSLKAFDSYF